MLRSSHRLYTTLPTTPPPLSSTPSPSPSPHSYLTTPPTATALAHAHTLFASHHHRTSQQQALFTTRRFRTLPATNVPELLLLGRSNVGKSSLLNALLGVPAKRYASESTRPGHTRALQGFAVGPGVVVAVERREGGRKVRVLRSGASAGSGLVLVDAPGYGFGSWEEWGIEVEKYLRRRLVLRRVFVLIESSHGLTPIDSKILSTLRDASVPHQIILTKVDKLIFGKSSTSIDEPLTSSQLSPLYNAIAKIRRQLHESQFTPLGDILCTSSKTTSIDKKEGRLGIDAVRSACLQAAGIEYVKQGKGGKRENDELLEGLQILEDR